MGLPAGIVETEEPLSMPPVRQKSSPVLVTVIAAKGLSVVEGAECSQCKSFSAFIFSEAFGVPRTGSSQSVDCWKQVNGELDCWKLG